MARAKEPGDKTSAHEQASFFDSASPIADDKVGHRSRLRSRFTNGGADAVPDYELLEMILFRVFPRGDTKPAAKRLLAKFGSFSEVVNASPERLKEVDGIGDRAVEELKLIKAACVATGIDWNCTVLRWPEYASTRSAFAPSSVRS